MNVFGECRIFALHIYIFRAKIVIEKKEEEYGFGYIQGN